MVDHGRLTFATRRQDYGKYGLRAAPLIFATRWRASHTFFSMLPSLAPTWLSTPCGLTSLSYSILAAKLRVLGFRVYGALLLCCLHCPKASSAYSTYVALGFSVQISIQAAVAALNMYYVSTWILRGTVRWHTLHHVTHSDIYAVNVPSKNDETFSRDVKKYKEPPATPKGSQ